MKLQKLIFALPVVMGMAIAQTQGTPPAPQDQTTAPQSQSNQMKKATKTTANDMKGDANRSGSALPEMKTATYKGTLVDMSCASQSAGNSGGESKAAGTESKGNECPVSANSSQFGLKMTDGRTVKFDLVGNQRAQDAVKNDKSWNKEITANKPLHVKVNGALNGDKLIVSSIH